MPQFIHLTSISVWIGPRSWPSCTELWAETNLPFGPSRTVLPVLSLQPPFILLNIRFWNLSAFNQCHPLRFLELRSHELQEVLWSLIVLYAFFFIKFFLYSIFWLFFPSPSFSQVFLTSLPLQVYSLSLHICYNNTNTQTKLGTNNSSTIASAKAKIKQKAHQTHQVYFVFLSCRVPRCGPVLDYGW